MIKDIDIYDLYYETRTNILKCLKKVMGRCDEPLNNTGINQAFETKNHLFDKDIDLIICSSLLGAKQTAEIINKNRNLLIIYDNRIIERNFEEFEGMQTSDFDFNENIPT